MAISIGREIKDKRQEKIESGLYLKKINRIGFFYHGPSSLDFRLLTINQDFGVKVSLNLNV